GERGQRANRGAPARPRGPADGDPAAAGPSAALVRRRQQPARRLHHALSALGGRAGTRRSSAVPSAGAAGVDDVATFIEWPESVLPTAGWEPEPRREHVDQGDLALDELAASGVEIEPARAIDLRKAPPVPGSGRPLHLEGIAPDAGDVDV